MRVMAPLAGQIQSSIATTPEVGGTGCVQVMMRDSWAPRGAVQGWLTFWASVVGARQHRTAVAMRAQRRSMRDLLSGWAGVGPRWAYASRRVGRGNL